MLTVKYGCASCIDSLGLATGRIGLCRSSNRASVHTALRPPPASSLHGQTHLYRSKLTRDTQDFSIRRTVGEGQHGRVLQCVHNAAPETDGPSASKVVAIKLFRDATTESHYYCGRELELMALGSHRNVVQVRAASMRQSRTSVNDTHRRAAPKKYFRSFRSKNTLAHVDAQGFGLVIIDGCPGIVMECLSESLLDLLEREAGKHACRVGSVLPYATLCTIGSQLIDVLAFLHGHNVRPHMPAANCASCAARTLGSSVCTHSRCTNA